MMWSLPYLSISEYLSLSIYLIALTHAAICSMLACHSYPFLNLDVHRNVSSVTQHIFPSCTKIIRSLMVYDFDMAIQAFSLQFFLFVFLETIQDP